MVQITLEFTLMNLTSLTLIMSALLGKASSVQWCLCNATKFSIAGEEREFLMYSGLELGMLAEH